MAERILQANLNNQGGAFSVAYEAQKKLVGEYIFDYYSPNKFIKNAVYDDLVSMGSRCIGTLEGGNRFKKQLILYKNLVSYLKKENYQFIHIHSDTSWKAAVYVLAARKAGVKNIVVHSHSSGINGHYRKINYLLHLICKSIVKKANYKCACSDVAAQWMFNTKEGVKIIRNGVDTEKFKFNSDARREIRERYKLGERFVIGSVSDFSYPKNPEFILNLIKSFANNEKYIFLLVGNRKDSELTDAAKKMGLKNVIFAGTVTNVQDYLSAMDIFILPSRFEGLPMCAVEAEVNGLLTIISDKVTDETKCSTHYLRLPLSISDWKRHIESADLNYDRNDRDTFLQLTKSDSNSTAEGFRSVYKGCASE